MAKTKKNPKLIMTIHLGGFFKKVDIEIWNDICSVRKPDPNRVEFTRDNGFKYKFASSDTAEVDEIYAITNAVIEGRNYGA